MKYAWERKRECEKERKKERENERKNERKREREKNILPKHISPLNNVTLSFNYIPSKWASKPCGLIKRNLFVFLREGKWRPETQPPPQDAFKLLDQHERHWSKSSDPGSRNLFRSALMGTEHETNPLTSGLCSVLLWQTAAKCVVSICMFIVRGTELQNGPSSRK